MKQRGAWSEGGEAMSKEHGVWSGKTARSKEHGAWSEGGEATSMEQEEQQRAESDTSDVRSVEC